MNALSELFNSAKSHSTVTLTPGKTYVITPENSFHLTGYYFSNTANQDENPFGERFCGIFLENKENVVIEGNGATVMMRGIMTPFLFKNCKNIVMRNLTFDHERPTMSEFAVVESTPGRATVRINPEYRYRVAGNLFYWQGEDNEVGEHYWEIPYKGPKVLTNAFNPETGIIDDMRAGRDDSRGGVPDIETLTELEKGTLALAFCDKERHIPVGTVAQTRCIVRMQTGGAIDDCENVTLENLRIMAMNGFGILGQNSRNLTYRALDCTPKAGRTVVSDADFFHFSGCSGEVKVLNCRAIGAHDDIINIHGTHLKIVGMSRESNTVILRYSHRESWGFNPYRAGEQVEFVNGNTLLAYHTATVCDVKNIDGTDFAVTFSSLPAREPAENDVVENISRTASLLVEGCTFGRIPSRAILCTTRRDVTIRNNTFQYMGAPILCVADDANFWFESGRSGLITLEGNTVIDCGAREGAIGTDAVRYEPVIMDNTSRTPVHRKLIMRGNHLHNSLSDKYTINLYYLAEAEIFDNRSDVPLEIKTDGLAEIKTDIQKIVKRA